MGGVELIHALSIDSDVHHGPIKGDFQGIPDAGLAGAGRSLRHGIDRAGAVQFIPHQIDNDSGVGTQVAATDLNGDKLPDVIVGNKKGSFVFLSSAAR